MTIASNIANGVARDVLVALKKSLREEGQNERADSLTLKQAMEHLSKTEEGQKYYINNVAAHLINANCFYKEASSLNEGVLNMVGANKLEIDCDLLTHVAMHCAHRHNMPLVPYRAPSHMYLGSTNFPDLAFEMTAFRKDERKGYGDPIGDGLFTTNTAKRDQGVFGKWSDHPDQLKKYGYFQPASAIDIEASITNAVLHGRAGVAERWRDYTTYEQIADKWTSLAGKYNCPGGIMLKRSSTHAYQRLAGLRTLQSKPEEAVAFERKADQYRAIADDHQDFIQTVEGVRMRLPQFIIQ